jgi:hypothetical protein
MIDESYPVSSIWHSIACLWSILRQDYMTEDTLDGAENPNRSLNALERY